MPCFLEKETRSGIKSGRFHGDFGELGWPGGLISGACAGRSMLRSDSRRDGFNRFRGLHSD
jgi:hypothetical protein